MNTDRLQREKEFHDERFSKNDSGRGGTTKYYSINTRLLKRYLEIVSEHCKSKKLLEYGCGTGGQAVQWLRLGAQLTGIDISEEGIKVAKKRIENTDYCAEYFVMNAESTEFKEDSFDIIVGTGIIHHLNLLESYRELSRILKTDGHAVFVEPLGHNPLINLYRALTPRLRTVDEHPLRQKDIRLLEKFFNDVEVEYFFLFTLLAVPFRRMVFFSRMCGVLGSIDNAIFQIPFVRKYAWMVIIHASNPKK